MFSLHRSTKTPKPINFSTLFLEQGNVYIHKFLNQDMAKIAKKQKQMDFHSYMAKCRKQYDFDGWIF